LKNSLTFIRQNLAALLLIALVLVILVTAMAYLLSPGVDWQYGFRPAVYAIRSGHSPYNLKGCADPAVESVGFFNAPWALLPLIPLARLPVKVGYAVLVIISLASFGWVVHRLGAKPVAIGLLLALAGSLPEMAAAVAGFWILIGIRALGI
jgi:hypothetical protein